MLKCCKNSYSVCDDFVGCPEGLVIKVPPGYPLEDIIIRVFKDGKMAYDVDGTIDEGGSVSIYTDDLPDGYINPFGATYSIQFILYTSGLVYEFMVQGGVYDSIEFNTVFGAALSSNFIIDIF